MVKIEFTHFLCDWPIIFMAKKVEVGASHFPWGLKEEVWIFCNSFFFYLHQPPLQAFVNSPLFLTLQVLSGQKFEFWAQNFNAANTILKLSTFIRPSQKIKILALNLHSAKIFDFCLTLWFLASNDPHSELLSHVY